MYGRFVRSPAAEYISTAQPLTEWRRTEFPQGFPSNGTVREVISATDQRDLYLAGAGAKIEPQKLMIGSEPREQDLPFSSSDEPAERPKTDAASPALSGELVVFTGRLAQMTQTEARAVAEKAGATAAGVVTLETSIVVVGCLAWPTLENGELTRNFRLAQRLMTERGKPKILSENRFFEIVGGKRPEEITRPFSLDVVCRVLSVPPETVRRWESFDLVRSANGGYDFQDIISLQTLMQFLARGVSLKTITKSLQTLKDCCPDIDRPLAQARIVTDAVDTIEFVAQRVRISAAGQLLLGFASDASQIGPKTAEEWFDHGLLLEAKGELDEAIDAYSMSIKLDYAFPEALFNLGNAYRTKGKIQVAERFYRQALEQDSTLASAWYNLGTLQVQRESLSQALINLRKAVDLHPGWADARFNLAIALEVNGSREDAIRQWEACLKCASTPEMAAEARRHLPLG